MPRVHRAFSPLFETLYAVPDRPANNEPQWQPAGRFSSEELPGDVRSWVTDEGSLTDRLTALGRGEFRVERLLQDWQEPLPSEQRLLDLPQGQLGLVREVALTLNDMPVVFARSVFPESSLPQRLLAKFVARSIDLSSLIRLFSLVLRHSVSL